MQACHQDKMRFNIRDGESSVVLPSSLLPGPESKCCKWKDGLPSVVTHLNAKVPPPISFIFLLLSFSPPPPPNPTHTHTFFSFYSLIIPLFCFLCFSLPLFPPSYLILVLLCHLSPPPSHRGVSHPHELRLHPRHQSETKNHLHLFRLALLPCNIHVGFQVINGVLKKDFCCTIVRELMKLYLTKLFCTCVMKHANEARSQGFAKLHSCQNQFLLNCRGRFKGQIRVCL